MFINVGAYVDEGTMVDSHALVGSCAQIGKRVHLSAAAQIGGVLEPVNAAPVVIEDDVLVGGNCGVYEGTLVRARAVLGRGRFSRDPRRSTTWCAAKSTAPLPTRRWKFQKMRSSCRDRAP